MSERRQTIAFLNARVVSLENELVMKQRHIENLMRLNSDWAHQSTRDGFVIKRLKALLAGRDPTLITNQQRLMEMSRAYAMEHGCTTRITNGVVEAHINGEWITVKFDK